MVAEENSQIWLFSSTGARASRNQARYWLEVTEPSATNLACICKINLWGVVWRGGLLDLASEKVTGSLGLALKEMHGSKIFARLPQ